MMKVSQIGVIAVMLIVIAAAFAGCTGSTPAAPATTGDTPSGGAASSGAPSAGSVLGIDKILEQKPYDWVEYKMSMKADGEDMIVYYKHNMKTGTCSMRFEGAGMEGFGGMTMDCSGSGGNSEAASNPNEMQSDAQFRFVTIEPVSVPAGTYPTASKYSITSQGETLYYWTAPGVPTFVKYSMKTDEGEIITELNGWG
jgi:hypothetical protein